MHPLVHSSSANTALLKSKWHSFKEWITPESITRRRPSQCSTTSTASTVSTQTATSHAAAPSTTPSHCMCCCNSKQIDPSLIQYRKRPSITALELGSISPLLPLGMDQNNSSKHYQTQCTSHLHSTTNTHLYSMMDKCIQPFRRRPSNASASYQQQQQLQHNESLLEKCYELYHFALDEINYAEDSKGSPYYPGDVVAAKEAIDKCEQAYVTLINQLSSHQQPLENDEAYKSHLQSTIGYKISMLKLQFESLPLAQDVDQRSF